MKPKADQSSKTGETLVSTPTSRTNFWKSVVIVVVAIAVIAAVWWLVPSSGGGGSSSTSSTTVTNLGNLDPRFIQQDVGVGDLNRVIGKGLFGHTAKEFTRSVLRVSGHSARALAIYANAAHLWDNPNSTKGLLIPDKKYLSQKGIMLWSALRGGLTAKGTKRSVGNAPANWYNSGVSGGKFGRAAVTGITGNRTSLVITFKDGSKFVALRRCGNLALPGPGRLPVVPTDNLKLKPKNWRQDAHARGHAPLGGGQNKTAGPGRYVPPSKMKHPGKAKRHNPASPKPITVPSGSTPDPEPTPPPEVPSPIATGTPPPIPGGN